MVPAVTSEAVQAAADTVRWLLSQGETEQSRLHGQEKAALRVLLAALSQATGLAVAEAIVAEIRRRIKRQELQQRTAIHYESRWSADDIVRELTELLDDTVPILSVALAAAGAKPEANVDAQDTAPTWQRPTPEGAVGEPEIAAETLPERVRREAALQPGEPNPLQVIAGALPDMPLPEEGPGAADILSALERTDGWEPREGLMHRWYVWRDTRYPTLTALGRAIIARESGQPAKGDEHLSDREPEVGSGDDPEPLSERKQRIEASGETPWTREPLWEHKSKGDGDHAETD